MASSASASASFEDSADAIATAKLSDSSSPSSSPEGSRLRLFNRQRSVHDLLGGGKLADVLLWREKHISAGILIISTLAWILLEHSGYTLLTIMSNVLLLLILAFFVWANAANFINKPPPRIPQLHLSEDMVVSFASSLRLEINKALAIAHDIALGKDMKVFVKVVAILYALSMVGGWFSILTLIYICTAISLAIPVIYERYEDQIDLHSKIAMDEVVKLYRIINNIIAQKISKTGFKDIKTQ